jgi:hypothetical protein
VTAKIAEGDVYLLGWGVDLNHRLLGYEPDENSNYNNLQDAGGYLKSL